MSNLKNILIIDDSPVFRESIKLILKDFYSVKTHNVFNGIDELLYESDADMLILGSDALSHEKLINLKGIVCHIKNRPAIFVLDKEESDRIAPIVPSNTAFLQRNAQSILNIIGLVERTFKNKFLHLESENEVDECEQVLDEELNLLAAMDSELKELILQVSGNTAPVFIGGEQGNSKELIARIMHNNSPLNINTFLNISIYNISENSIYSFLVEHLKVKKSLMGTIYIDEVVNISINIQEQIVCLIDKIIEGELKNKGIDSINIMVIVSSDKNLFSLLQDGAISEKLYYRVSSIPIFIPSLREKSLNMGNIVKSMVLLLSKRFSIPPKDFTHDAITLMQNYIWPGNLDELRSVIIRSIIFSKKNIVDVNELRFFFGIKEINMTASGILGRDSKDVAKDKNLSFGDENDVNEDFFKDNNELVINLAHEIKNPLVGIKTFASLLPHKYDDEEFRNDFYRLVNADVEKIDSLVERIIEFKNVKSGIEEECDINELLTEISEEASDMLEEKRIKLEINLEKDAPLITGLRNAYKYAIDNILKTVVDACKEGGKLKMSSKCCDVNGDGINVEVQLVAETEMNFDIGNSIALDGTAVLLAKRAIERYRGDVVRYSKEDEGYKGFVLQLKHCDAVSLGE